MSHLIYRAELAEYAGRVKRGQGPLLYGARWNSAGLAAVYCAGSLSLSVLEILVHLTKKSAGVERVYFAIELDELAVEVLPRTSIPVPFNGATSYGLTQPLGDAWLKSKRSVALKVPSAIIPGEFNYVLNSDHPDFDEATWWGPRAALEIDKRLLVGPVALPPPRLKGRRKA